LGCGNAFSKIQECFAPNFANDGTVLRFSDSIEGLVRDLAQALPILPARVIRVAAWLAIFCFAVRATG
jgi:hypothetical protein